MARWGFKRQDLSGRYDVTIMREDAWHAHTGRKTNEILQSHLSGADGTLSWLLNAGSGVYEIGMAGWREIPLDLFLSPIMRRQGAVCATVEHLPFRDGVIAGAVCVGEVLAYCDPAVTIREFARVLVPTGTLICDFRSSRSFRYWFRSPYGKAAELVTDIYNGTPEQTWVYNSAYITSILVAHDFHIRAVLATHTWSALARRVGLPARLSLLMEQCLGRFSLSKTWADVTTIVAARGGDATRRQRTTS